MFILGHSAGGVIACNYVLDNQADIAGLICESFAYRVPAPDFALAVLKGLSHLAPHAHVLNLPKKEFSRDPKVTQALIDDPLLANEVQPTKTVAEMVRADERLKRDFPLFKLPLLIIHGTKDTVTRPEGSQEFYDRASSADKTLKLYEGYFHDPLNDIGKEAVMADIRAWIEKRLPALSAARAHRHARRACSRMHAADARRLTSPRIATTPIAWRICALALQPAGDVRAGEGRARRRLSRSRYLDRAHFRLPGAVHRTRLQSSRLLRVTATGATTSPA